MHLALIGGGVEIGNLRTNLLATSRPTSDLPEPDTPVRTIARAFPGNEPIAVILELILGELGSAIAESIFSANVCSWREGKRGNAAAGVSLSTVFDVLVSLQRIEFSSNARIDIKERRPFAASMIFLLMPVPETTSAENLFRYVGGKCLASGRGEAWRNIKASVIALPPVIDALHMPSVSEPVLVWITSGEVEVQERENGGPGSQTG